MILKPEFLLMIFQYCFLKGIHPGLTLMQFRKKLMK